MKELNLNQLENINGGDNVNDCFASVGGTGASFAAAVGGLALTGPVGWAVIGGGAVATGAAAFLSGYNCAKLAYEGK